jgi:hypothetical protein
VKFVEQSQRFQSQGCAALAHSAKLIPQAETGRREESRENGHGSKVFGKRLPNDDGLLRGRRSIHLLASCAEGSRLYGSSSTSRASGSTERR